MVKGEGIQISREGNDGCQGEKSIEKSELEILAFW